MQPGGSKVFRPHATICRKLRVLHIQTQVARGKTFRQVWRMFSHGTVAGLTNDKGTMAGPRDDDIVGPEGEITVIADNLETIRADIRKKRRGR